MEDAFTRALESAERAGDLREEGWILRMLALVYRQADAGRAGDRPLRGDSSAAGDT